MHIKMWMWDSAKVSTTGSVEFLKALVAMEPRIKRLGRQLGRSMRKAGERRSARRRASPKAEQIGARIDAKTADNVPVELRVAVRYYAPVHYGVLAENTDDAFNDLDEAGVRLGSSISEAVLACVPSVKFDEPFDRHEEIADAVPRELAPMMDRPGFEILDARVVDISVSGPRRSREIERWESEGGGT
jgi:regulator of protease activity HflC (stomatin/prohibitin superfamily)